MSHIDFIIKDTTIRYVIDDDGRVGLLVFPSKMEENLVTRRESLRGERFIDVLPGNDPWSARALDSLVQVKILGDPYPGGFATGHTMRNSPTLDGFKFAGQICEKGKIVTSLRDHRGYHIEHKLSWHDGDYGFRIETEFHNESDKQVTLEMLSSFSLGGISPFAVSDGSGRLHVHRFRSAWAAEGRLESRTLEDLHLERSWSGAGVVSERFGQIGTMPVRKWFPFIAVEDCGAEVIWGAQIAWAGSWQMEIYRQHDEIALSGGLADREFGHWMKTLKPGESLTSPSANIACVNGKLDDLCDRLTQLQVAAVNQQPEIEQDLPIIFNEFCTTWGSPSHENVMAIADRLRDSGVSYLVIDAGWYRPGQTHWDGTHGDWCPSKDLFPDGLAACAAAIRERGLIPGLWFEIETAGEHSLAFSLVDRMLKRDGTPITVRGRRFWNMNDRFVIEYLTEKVIDLLERCEFGYLKIDYNESLGLGSDDFESLGEGLRKQVTASYQFIEAIRKRLPQLVIESCSSGGHRLEPSMLGLTAMSSFSDAHELDEIPIIAANMHRLMLPRQCQIWAVLHSMDSLKRIRYSLASTFLGRMCLSGEIEHLPVESWQLTQEAITLYQKAVPVIKHGISRRFGDIGPSWRHATGWQAIVRTSDDLTLVVMHQFAESPEQVSIPLVGEWNIDHIISDGVVEVTDMGLDVKLDGDFNAAVILLNRHCNIN